MSCHENDLDDLLNKVSNLPGHGIAAGFLNVFSSAGFPILGGQCGPNIFPIAAGGRLGAGKIVGFSHDSFLTVCCEPAVAGGHSDKNSLIVKSVRWTSSSPKNEGQPIQVALVSNLSWSPQKQRGTHELLTTTNGICASSISIKELEDNLVKLGDDYQEVAKKFNVLCICQSFEEKLIPLLQRFVQNGGGLILAITAWVYNPDYQGYPSFYGHFASTFPPNQLTRHAGFVWRDDFEYARATGADGNFSADRKFLKNAHFLPFWNKAINCFNDHCPNSTEETGEKTDDKMTISALKCGLEFLPVEEFPRFQLEFNQVIAKASNYKGHSDPIFEKIRLQIFCLLSSTILKFSMDGTDTCTDVPVHDSCQIFPGMAANFDKICNTEFEGRTMFHFSNKNKSKHPIWISTSYYAVPGKWIEMRIVAPPLSSSKLSENFDQILKNYALQIGCHTDDISRHKKWERAPQITVKTLFQNGVARLASPFGGLIYIVVPPTTKLIDEFKNNGDFKLTATISGGRLPAPYFKLGETSLSEWRDKLKHGRGPWAEFASDKIIITVPSSCAVEVEDPEQLLLFWDHVMDAMADLAAIPRDREKPERIVADVQISVGFLHSGYPIMCHLETGADAVKIEKLRKDGSSPWGFFHELGHNHQKSDWTFSGSEEVTCNLFTLYVFNVVLGIATHETRTELTPTHYKKVVAKYLKNGPKFSDWENDPFLALLFYYQLQSTFGWTAFKQTFAKYHELELNEDRQGRRPETDQEKIALWLVTFSRVVRRNLTKFFHSWGFPISDPNEESWIFSGQPQLSDLPDSPISINDLLLDDRSNLIQH